VSETEALKIFSKIESEAALKAFESWMELQWFDAYMQIGAISIVVITVFYCRGIR